MTVVDSPLAEALRTRYLLERELGRGGMATVYLARDLQHDRPVALKVLHAEFARAFGPERFLREIRLAARLSHPHILPVFDSGETAGGLWYTMPYVAGESLRDRLRRERQLPVEDAVRIARQVAAALAYAHGHGVIHRDIKPENVLLSENAPPDLAGGTGAGAYEAVVADFGVALAADAGSMSRLTETGLAVGTVTYMSSPPSPGGPPGGTPPHSSVRRHAPSRWREQERRPPIAHLRVTRLPRRRRISPSPGGTPPAPSSASSRWTATSVRPAISIG